MTGHARAAWYCPSCCCDLFGCRGKCIAAAVIHMLLQLLVLCCAVLCCAVLCCACLVVLCCAARPCVLVLHGLLTNAVITP